MHAVATQRAGGDIAAAQVLLHRPVGQRGHAASAGDQLQHHRGELRGAPARGLHAGGLQEISVDVEALALDRVGDQRLPGEVGGLDPLAPGERVVGGHGQQRLVAEQRPVDQPLDLAGVGGDDQIHVAAGEGGQRLDAEAHREIHLHVGPVDAVGVHGRDEPLEAAVALDGDVQPAGLTAGHPRDLSLGHLHRRQHPIGQPQQALARLGEAQWPTLALEQPHPEGFLEILDLVRERRLRQMQVVRRASEATRIAQDGEGVEVAELDRHGRRLPDLYELK